MERQRPVREMHQTACLGFGAEAEAYDRARPSYPPDAVGWLAARLGIGPGRRVLDLAAGTGKLTAPLAGYGADLVAAEPVDAMRGLLRQRLPGLPLLAAVAEALPFTAGCLDAVVVAQAFHWFDGERALAELARVVRPGGGLGLIWNALDRDTDWTDRLWQVMDRVECGVRWRRRGDQGRPDSEMADSEEYLAGGHGWSEWTEAAFRHEHMLTRADVVDRMRSVSHIAVLPAGQQQDVLDEIRAILDGHPATAGRDTLAMPYRVRAMYAGRVP